MRSREVTSAIVGLLAAWGGTAMLASSVLLPLSHTWPVVTGLLGQLAQWLLCAAVIGIVLFWEKKPLASLWLRPFQYQSLGWAGVLIAAQIFLVFPATELVRKSLGLRGYAAGVEMALAFPLWVRILAVITAGAVEEILFRGYAVTRLAMLTGRLPVAVILSSAMFAALHLPVWGAGPSLAFFIGGLLTSSFFVWRQDLLAMIIAHVAIDAWGLLISPGFSRWWA